MSHSSECRIGDSFPVQATLASALPAGDGQRGSLFLQKGDNAQSVDDWFRY